MCTKMRSKRNTKPVSQSALKDTQKITRVAFSELLIFRTTIQWQFQKRFLA